MTLNTIIQGDALTRLRELPADSVDCCVTSPPYYGLRDYGTAKWEGGNPECKHSVREETNFENWKQSSNRGNSKPPKGVCPKCGAVRVDSQLGLEDTPEDYINRLVGVFGEVRRVLKPAGTLWLNIGDSYWGGKGYSGMSAGDYQYQRKKAGKSINPAASNIGGKGSIRPTDKKHDTIKPKDMIGIPWLLGLALRANGWHLRQDIIWHKPNPMPESAADRCTKSHEYILLLSKSAQYYFDADSIKEPQSANTHSRYGKNVEQGLSNVPAVRENSKEANRPGYKDYRKYTLKTFLQDGRNKRDVWTVATKPCIEAHFATYPQELIVDCIKAGCPQGGVVLDPFMGAGTTGVVARKLNRNFIGIELNPKYIKIAERRLKNELGMFL